MPKTPPEDLPHYIHADLRARFDELNLVLDIWNNLQNGFKKYILQEQEEPLDQYEKRLSQTVFDNLFSPAIKSYSGLLSRFKLLEGTPTSIVESLSNIDGRGSSLEVFLQDGDDNVLRDGAVFFIVDYPDTSELNIKTPIDLKRSNLRPFLTLVDRRDFINWDYEVLNGVFVLNWAIVREYRTIAKGRYGKQTVEIFREFVRGDDSTNFRCFCDEWEIKKDDKGDEYAVQQGERQFYSMLDIPILAYSATDRDPLTCSPPFLTTARLNIQILRKQSQLDDVLRRINLPAPVRIGAEKISSPGSPTGFAYPPLILGSHHVVDLPVGGSFSFEEPTGNAIESTERDIEKLRNAIDRVSLAFLSNQRSGSMTATEALLNTAQVTTTINGIARRKESVVQEIFAIWADYTNEPFDRAASGIAIDDSIIKPPLSELGEQTIYNAMESRVISARVAFAKLKEGLAMPEGITEAEFVQHFERMTGALDVGEI